MRFLPQILGVEAHVGIWMKDFRPWKPLFGETSHVLPRNPAFLAAPLEYAQPPFAHFTPKAPESARRQRYSFLLRWHLYALEANLTNINGNHKHFRNRSAVRPARVRAALGRKMNSIRDDIV